MSEPRPSPREVRPPHEHRLTVRYAETDQMGVVHHAQYLVYVEEGRTRLMAESGCSYGELERRGVGLPVRKARLRYLAPARYEDELTVRTRVAEVGRASVTFETEICRPADGATVARAEIELACVDLSRPERPIARLPDEVRRLAEATRAGA